MKNDGLVKSACKGIAISRTYKFFDSYFSFAIQKLCSLFDVLPVVIYIEEYKEHMPRKVSCAACAYMCKMIIFYAVGLLEPLS